MHATILGFLLITLVFVLIKITINAEAGEGNVVGPIAPIKATNNTKVTAGKLVALGTVALIYLVVNMFEFIPPCLPRLKPR